MVYLHTNQQLLQALTHALQLKIYGICLVVGFSSRFPAHKSYHTKKHTPYQSGQHATEPTCLVSTCGLAMAKVGESEGLNTSSLMVFTDLMNRCV